MRPNPKLTLTLIPTLIRILITLTLTRCVARYTRLRTSCGRMCCLSSNPCPYPYPYPYP